MDLKKFGASTVTQNLSNPQPPPTQNQTHLPSMHDLVIKDFEDRKEFGLRKYGQLLQPHNGRDPIFDAYQEVMDLAVYLRQKIWEEYGI